MRKYIVFCLAFFLGGMSVAIPQEVLSDKTLHFDIDKIASYSRPKYLPKSSDVIMRSLKFRPMDALDSNNTFEALKAFHVTRLEWVYINNTPGDLKNIKAVKTSGVLFGGSGGPMSGLKSRKENGKWVIDHSVVDLKGESVILGHMVHWAKPESPGCVNHMVFYKNHLNHYKRYLDAGAQTLQRDGVSQNHSFSIRGSGCYCHECTRKFSLWLSRNFTKNELREKFGIDKVKQFNYASHLLKEGMEVKRDSFDWSDPKAIISLLDDEPLSIPFQKFQEECVADFFTRLRIDLNNYARRYVPFSCNNTSNQRWDEYNKVFDFAMSELMLKTANPVHLNDRAVAARKLGKIQVFSTPKTMGEKMPAQTLKALNRKVIATCYASGGLCKVPWDLFNQSKDGKERYFGKPEDYADLYGFVRGMAPYLDDYEEAFAIGTGIGSDLRLPITVSEDSVYAFCRVNSDPKDSSIVIHLVDWRDSPDTFHIDLNCVDFFDGANYVAELYRPPVYDASLHSAAHQRNDYSELTTAHELTLMNVNQTKRAEIPSLHPWGILVLKKR